jgi:hypothetical protein
LLLAFVKEEKIDWEKEFITITDILREVIKKRSNKIPPQPIDQKIPDYDIIGNIKKPRRKLLDWLRKLW